MSTKRNAILVAVMALAVTGSTFGIASAQDNATPECGAALSKLVDARADLNKALAADKFAADAQKLHDDLAKARAEEAAAVKADNETVPPLSADSQRTKDAKADVIRLVALVNAITPTLEDRRAEAAKTDAEELADVAAKVQDEADKACEGEPGDPGPVVTVPPAPPVTVTPAPPAVVVVPQVPVKPSGGVETGDGSLA